MYSTKYKRQTKQSIESITLMPALCKLQVKYRLTTAKEEVGFTLTGVYLVQHIDDIYFN